MVGILPSSSTLVNYTYKKAAFLTFYLVILANNYILCIEKLLVFLITDIIATVEGFL